MAKINWEKIQAEAKRNETIHVKETLWTNRIIHVFMLGLLVVGLLVTIFAYIKIDGALSPSDVKDSSKLEVTIPMGSTSSDIAQILEDKGLTSSSKIFSLYMKFKGSHNFQAGTYEFSKQMGANELLATLEEGGKPIYEDVDTTLTVVEGMQLEEIAKLVEENTPISAEDFIKAADNQNLIDQLTVSFPSLLKPLTEIENLKHPLEGYLYPATYDYISGSTAEDLITQMVTKANLEFQSLLEDLNNTAFSYHQILTLASIVEREAVTDEDRALVAGVFYNRLNAGMPLQSDITVSYALGEHKELVTYQDLEVESPYNTYKASALPPGPINNPSLSAIKACIYPSSNNYYYFVADLKTGKIYYSQSQEEHDALVKEYVQPLFEESSNKEQETSRSSE